jgi:hypothetical protein
VRAVLLALLRLYPLAPGTLQAVSNNIMVAREGVVFCELDQMYGALLSRVELGFAQYERSGGFPQALVLCNLLATFSENHAGPTIITPAVVAGLFKMAQRVQKDLATSELACELALRVVDLLVNPMVQLDATQKKTLVALLQASLERAPGVDFAAALAKRSMDWIRASMNSGGSATATAATATAGAAAMNASGSITEREAALLQHKAVAVLVKRAPGDSITVKALDAVLDVYTETSAANPAVSASAAAAGGDTNAAASGGTSSNDLNARLEALFFAGLSSPVLAQRDKFFALFALPVRGLPLHGRLDYCLNEKYNRWDGGKGGFWLAHCLDTVLVGAESSAPGVPMTPDSLSFARAPTGSAALSASAGAASAALLSEHSSAMTAARSQGTLAALLRSLRTLGHHHSPLAHDLWVRMFPQAWAVLSDEARLSVAQVLQNLLQQDYLEEQAAQRPSCARALVIGVARCPMPLLSLVPAVLHHVAHTHGLWHTCIHLLRNQQLRAEARGERTADGCFDQYHDALADLCVVFFFFLLR